MVFSSNSRDKELPGVGGWVGRHDHAICSCIMQLISGVFEHSICCVYGKFMQSARLEHSTVTTQMLLNNSECLDKLGSQMLTVIYCSHISSEEGQ